MNIYIIIAAIFLGLVSTSGCKSLTSDTKGLGRDDGVFDCGNLDPANPNHDVNGDFVFDDKDVAACYSMGLDHIKMKIDAKENIFNDYLHTYAKPL